MAKAATKPKTKREMPDGTPVSPMVDKAMDRFDAKRAELAAQPPKPTRAPDNGDKVAFEAVCAKPRVYLCEAMLAAPIGPEKDKAKAAYVAFCEVAIAAKAGRGWDEGLVDQLVDMQAVIDTHEAHAAQARDRWAAANGSPVHAPIGADLIEWLMAQLSEVERDLQDAMKTRPAFVRMSTPVLAPAKPAPAKAVRHEVDLGPLNEAPPVVEGRKRPRPPRG